MDDYQLHLEKKHSEYEAVCRRCGSCCGIRDADPCEHLAFTEDGKAFCEIYDHRYGLRQTLSGTKFLCIPIRKALGRTWSGVSQCAYQKIRP